MSITMQIARITADEAAMVGAGMADDDFIEWVDDQFAPIHDFRDFPPRPDRDAFDDEDSFANAFHAWRESISSRMEENANDPQILDLEKAWHGIHFLLCGSAWLTDRPSSYLAGGTEVGPDIGYGPARLLSPDQTFAFSNAVNAVGSDALRQRYDPSAMEAAEIYPAIWVRDGKEGLEWLLAFFRRMPGFLADAASSGDGLLIRTV